MTALLDHLRYNKLPYLEEANISRQAPSVDDIIAGPIRDVFLKHDAHTALCLYLQHRHHTIDADKAVVKVKGTGHLMDRQAVQDIVAFGNKVVPTTWMTCDDQLLPMEFAVVPATTTTSTPTDSFVLDFLSVLRLNGCNRLFGIGTIAKGSWTEMSIGDASVVVPNHASDCYKKDKSIPVAFTFDKEKPKFMVHGRCNQGQHRHTSRPPKPQPEPKPQS